MNVIEDEGVRRPIPAVDQHAAAPDFSSAFGDWSPIAYL